MSNMLKAVQAYGQHTKQLQAAEDKLQGLSNAGGAGQDSQSPFAKILGDAMQDVTGTVARNEQVTQQMLQGKADMVDVVEAFNSAELMVQGIREIRDRMVSAYQDIMRMPI